MAMKNPFKTASPYQGIEQARRARLVVSVAQIGLYFSLPLSLLVGLITLFNHSPQMLVVTVLCLGTAPVCWGTKALGVQGRPDPAAEVFLAYFLGILAVNTLIVQGIFPLLVPGYLLVIVVGGLILPPARAYLVAAIASALYLAAEYVRSVGVPATPLAAPLAITFVNVIVVMAFAFVALINQLITRDLRKALDDATADLFQANRKLEQASEMKSQFTARTSHELRTPLSSIIAFTDLALRESYGPLNPKLREALGYVFTSARHLKDVIGDILDLSKIEAGELAIAEEDFPLSQLVQALRSTSAEAAEEKGLRWSEWISPDLPAHLRGDPRRLTQVLLNLTGNAVKFTEAGEVGVRIEATGDQRWRIAVRDTGPGIPEDQFETVFQAYRQLDKTVSPSKVKGTGLGLAITRHLVRMMGGTIKVESELGKGSRFTVELPLKVGTGEAQVMSPTPEPRPV